MEKTVVGLIPASELAGVEPSSVLRWCRKLDIGELREGVWHIDTAKLFEVINARRVLRVRERA